MSDHTTARSVWLLVHASFTVSYKNAEDRPRISPPPLDPMAPYSNRLAQATTLQATVGAYFIGAIVVVG